MPQVTQRQIARNDLIEHFIYLAENAGLDIADRFLTNAETTFNLLAEQPNLGVALALRSSDLTGLRKWHVKDFEDVLLYLSATPRWCGDCPCSAWDAGLVEVAEIRCLPSI
jgi:toxin ParE1/3/4